MTVTIRLRVILYAFTAAILGAALMYVALDAMRVDAAPGDTDTTYVPTAGCRLADTRSGTDNVGQHSGPLGSGGVYQFQVTGANGRCTGPLAIPDHATGVALNVTAVAPTASSNIRVYPANLSQVPLLSNLNVTAGASPIPNKVDVSLSPGGAIKVYNQQGNVHIVIDLLGYYTKDSLTEIDDRLTDLETATPTEPNLTAITDRLDTLETQVADLQTEHANLKAKLANVSVVEDADGHPTIRFSGVNVQIVDGTGDTPCNAGSFEACNGLGNLIIGYNEDPGDDGSRSGSHNLEIGFDNDYTGHSGIVAGYLNAISHEYATVTGGIGNTANQFASSVSGGQGNTASGAYSAVSGGVNNTAVGDHSSVSGGSTNVASGRRSSVSGGQDNTATGPHSSISAGHDNSADGTYSSVSGGQRNIAVGPVSSVSSGRLNTAEGSYSWVSGGQANTASGHWASISGGRDNTAAADFASVSGGQANIASGEYSSVSGGQDSTASASWASVSGGFANSAEGQWASASGGQGNAARGSYASVSGGAIRSADGGHDWSAGSLWENF